MKVASKYKSRIPNVCNLLVNQVLDRPNRASF